MPRFRWGANIAMSVGALLVAAVVGSAAPVLLSSTPAYGTGGAVCESGYPPGPSGVLVSTSVASPGQQVRVTGEGYTPAATVVLELQPGAVVLAHVQTDAHGGIAATVAIPADTPPGNYDIVATGGCKTDPHVVLRLPVDITIQTAGGQPAPAPPPRGGLLASTGAPSLATLIASLALVVLGSAVVLATRRRRTR